MSPSLLNGVLAYGFEALAFVFGSIVGSFLNVVIARLPRGESIVHPPSHCPNCGDQIPPWLNVPILSWLALRGKCRACRTPISIRYPVVEALTGVLYTACAVRFGFSIAFGSGVLLCTALVTITFIDLDIWEIPDEISLPGILIGWVLRPFAYGVPWYDGVLGALMGAFLFWFIRWFFFVVRKKEGMGLGDVKLIAMIGAFLGPMALVPTILVSSVVGTFIGILMLALGWNKDESDEAAEEASPKPPSPLPSGEDMAEEEEEEWVPPKYAVPFGPFLALGALTALLFDKGFDWLLFKLYS